LREAALESLVTKCDVLEGAAAFATFTPPYLRRKVVRAITAFEIAFDYLDTIVELPNPEPVANTGSLGQALLAAFESGQGHADYYKHHDGRDDAGYLEGLVDTCRETLETLPSSAIVAEPAHHALSQIVTYQSLHHGDGRRSHDAFKDWACAQYTSGADLQWWEVGAAMGSQLYVLALIAAAADPATRPAQIAAIGYAYVPWIGALSTLLDSVIDQHEDRTAGQASLVDYYNSPKIVAERLRVMTIEARRLLHQLPDAENHILVLAGMAALFHSAPQASAPEVGIATRAVVDAMGAQVIPVLLLIKARRALSRSHQRF
jgi:tetraprenyl-beta-curcumene synthase